MDHRVDWQATGAAAYAERDIALETDKRILARLSAKDKAVKRRAFIVGGIGSAAILVWLALLLALGETPIFMICGLFPAFLTATIVGIFVLLGAHLKNKQWRDRARLASSIELQATMAFQGLTLPVRVRVNHQAPIPEVTGWFAATPFEAGVLVQSVTASAGETVLEIPPNDELRAGLGHLLSQAEYGAALEADPEQRHKLNSLPISPNDITEESLSLLERERLRRSLAIPAGGISRVHVAIDNGVWAVFHIFFQREPTERVQVYSFTLANPSDLGVFWAALKSQIPPERLVIPRATIWQVQP